MRRFKPEFFALLAYLSGWASHGSSIEDELLSEDQKARGKRIVGQMRSQIENYGLSASLASTRRLLDLFEESPTYGGIKSLLEELNGRVIDELACQYFLALSPAEAGRFDRWRDEWEPVLERFPDITRDVEEMNKCFALNRFTAAMFHALHVAEWGAIQLGHAIGVADPKKGWGPTEKKLKEIIRWSARQILYQWE